MSREATAASVAQARDNRASSDAERLASHALAGASEPLNSSIRREMEPVFGHDFSQVRVHTDSAASRSARAVNASADTVGSDVVFGAGRYSPGAREGDRLLAHELTHVVQNGAGGGRSSASANQLGAGEKADVASVIRHLRPMRAAAAAVKWPDSVRDEVVSILDGITVDSIPRAVERSGLSLSAQVDATTTDLIKAPGTQEGFRAVADTAADMLAMFDTIKPDEDPTGVAAAKETFTLGIANIAPLALGKEEALKTVQKALNGAADRISGLVGDSPPAPETGEPGKDDKEDQARRTRRPTRRHRRIRCRRLHRRRREPGAGAGLGNR